MIMEQSPLERYADIQPLVQKDISDAVSRSQERQQYEVVKVPGHAHTGADSPLVQFFDLDGVQYHSLLRTTVLSPAQVKALFTTPIELVPAPQTTRGVWIVHGITGRLAYAGTAYTGVNPLEFRYTNAAGQKATDDMPVAFLNSASSAFSHAVPPGATFTPVAGGSGANGKIVVCAGVANPATGNSPLYLTVLYRLVAFPT